MKRLFGVSDPRDRSSETREIRSTFEDAVKAWEELREKEPSVDFHIVGWNHGVIAHFTDVRDLFAKPVGTFKCPICFESSPHTHTAEEISEHRDHRQYMAQVHERRRAEILRIVAHIVDTYGSPREAVAGDFGFRPTVGEEHGK